MRKQKFKSKVFTYFVLCLFLVAVLFPIYWMINTSLKADIEIYTSTPTFFPKKIVLDGYIELFFETPFLRSIYNSIVVSLSVAIITVFFSMLASYAITRLNIRGGAFLSRCVLYTYLVPKNLLFIPVYMFLTTMGIIGTRGSLIFLYPTFTIPYAMWMMIAYFKTVPKEMEDAARVDGCNHLQTMFKVFFPLASPGIVSTFIFCFTLAWNEYLYAFVMVTDSEAKTFPLMLSDLMVDDVFAWGPLMAGSLLSCVPIFLVYLLASSKISGGLTMGAVKA